MAGSSYHMVIAWFQDLGLYLPSRWHAPVSKSTLTDTFWRLQIQKHIKKLKTNLHFWAFMAGSSYCMVIAMASRLGFYVHPVYWQIAKSSQR